MSARSVPAYGPAMKLPSSRTRIPSSAAVGTDDLVVEAEQLVRNVRPVELARPKRSRGAEPRPEGRLVHQPLQRRAERVGVLRLDEQARHVPLDHTLVAMDVARDHRGAGRHGLEEDDAEGLLAGGR